jgi:hypothetical protein
MNRPNQWLTGFGLLNDKSIYHEKICPCYPHLVIKSKIAWISRPVWWIRRTTPDSVRRDRDVRADLSDPLFSTTFN